MEKERRLNPTNSNHRNDQSQSSIGTQSQMAIEDPTSCKNEVVTDTPTCEFYNGLLNVNMVITVSVKKY